MTAEELSQFNLYEAKHFNLWLDHNMSYVLENFEKPGYNTIYWRGVSGDYSFSAKQFHDFMEIRNSPLYKALL